MTTLAEIQADRHKWKKITGTGTAPYNPARYELKEKYKKEQRKQLKKTTTPTTTKRVDKPTTTTTTQTDTGTPIRKRLSSAVDRAAAGKRAVAKVYSRATEKAAATARGKAARERLYSGARKGSDPKEVARRIALRQERAPVTKRPLITSPKHRIPTAVQDLPTYSRYPDFKTVTSKTRGRPKVSNEEAKRRMLKTLKESPHGEPSRRVYPLSVDLEELLVEKTGGKVSRKKGSTVSRTEGGTVWNGNNAVAEGYDPV